MTVQHLTIEQLNAYLDGECGEAELPTISSHLDACATCQSEMDTLALIQNAYSGLGEVEVPRSFVLTPAAVTPLASPGVVTPLRSETRRWEKVARFVAIAAAIAFLALGAAQLTGLVGDSNNGPSSQIAMDSETNTDRAALQEQEPAQALARGQVRESGESAAIGASALQAELARVDTPAQVENNGLTPLEITTVGIGIVALAAIAGWILIHYRADTVS
ncbi:MAG: zf-HC2 domain-containing protein [Thermomicrobiales bacterium]|nr:zf-HC2 domain-containing protein [Thermomicrobiales bacterium]